jgi:hypothetical protein
VCRINIAQSVKSTRPPPSHPINTNSINIHTTHTHTHTHTQNTHRKHLAPARLGDRRGEDGEGVKAEDGHVELLGRRAVGELELPGDLLLPGLDRHGAVNPVVKRVQGVIVDLRIGLCRPGLDQGQAWVRPPLQDGLRGPVEAEEEVLVGRGAAVVDDRVHGDGPVAAGGGPGLLPLGVEGQDAAVLPCRLLRFLDRLGVLVLVAMCRCGQREQEEEGGGGRPEERGEAGGDHFPGVRVGGWGGGRYERKEVEGEGATSLGCFHGGQTHTSDRALLAAYPRALTLSLATPWPPASCLRCCCRWGRLPE